MYHKFVCDCLIEKYKWNIKDKIVLAGEKEYIYGCETHTHTHTHICPVST
jgi:hypothetical protein